MLSRLFCAAMVAGSATISTAAPNRPVAAPEAGEGILHKVSGCHRGVEYHFVPEFGRSAWHYHRGGLCRPIEAPPPPPPPPPQDCHRDVRRHYLEEYGRRVTHRHVGPSCRVQVFEEVGPGGPPSGVCVTIAGVQFCLQQ
jgi:hypothetical protein